MKKHRISKILIICLTVALVHSIAFAASNDRAIIFRPKATAPKEEAPKAASPVVVTPAAAPVVASSES